ncbi:MAG: hypothetical protein ACRCY7_04220 [Cetobacterium sp.]|uniref:hypothetical protein n=1 Tax=Cetobacterium sp. TaxID=2071632 RepID=UPI003F2CB6BF
MNNLFNRISALIELTEELDNNKLNKIQDNFNKFEDFQKKNLLEALLKKESCIERILDILLIEISQNKSFNKYYLTNLLESVDDILNKNFSILISKLNKKEDIFGVVFKVAYNNEKFTPILTSGDELKNYLVKSLKDSKRLKVFLKKSKESYRYKILGFLVYSSPDDIGMDNLIRNKVENFIRENLEDFESDKYQSEKTNQIKKILNEESIIPSELQQKIFRFELSTGELIDFNELFFKKRIFISKNILEFKHEFILKLFRSIDEENRRNLIKEICLNNQGKILNSMVLGLIASYVLEDDSYRKEEEVLKCLYTYLKNDIDKNTKNIGKIDLRTHNNLNTLLELYFKYNEYSNYIAGKKEELKNSYGSFYWYYLAFYTVTGEEDIHEADFDSLLKGLVYRQYRIKKKVLTKIFDLGRGDEVFSFIKNSRGNQIKSYIYYLIKEKKEFEDVLTDENIESFKQLVFEIDIYNRRNDLSSALFKNIEKVRIDLELVIYFFKSMNTEKFILRLLTIPEENSFIFSDELSKILENIKSAELKIIFLIWASKGILLFDDSLKELEKYRDVVVSEKVIRKFGMTKEFNNDNKVWIEKLQPII